MGTRTTLGTKTTIRVMVVDDHPVLRSGLANLLALEGDLVIAAELAVGAEAVRLWKACRADVALIDLWMPVMDGEQTLREILRIDPAARVLMFSSSESAADAARMERVGACGFITKATDAKQIAAAIRQVYGGERGVRRGALRGAAQLAEEQLSHREAEVLALLRQGFTNVQIARRLAIAEATVKAHMGSLMEKLHAPDRAGVVARAFDLGILRPETQR